MYTDLQTLEKSGTDAVKRLRKQKLEAGVPFMINSNELPSKQSYMEYPDKSMTIVTIATDQHSFEIVRKLSDDEANSVRRRYKLL